MLWEDLTADEFEWAVSASGQTCLFPFGVIEKHGSHLPLSTDMQIGRKIAQEAAKLEPVVVFPYYYFGQINEARHVPGTIAIKPELEYALLQEIFTEIARNGFKKIIILSSHGGNIAFVEYVMQGSLYEKKDYALYNINFFSWLTPEQQEEMKNILHLTQVMDHAGVIETSLMLAIQPELVHMDQVNPEGKKNLGRLNHLQGVASSISWYANYPTHQAGDPSDATKTAGEKIIRYAARNIAKAIKLVKEDQVAERLQKEFFAACSK
ncbi:MAG: Creatinine amidohydrolase [Firmicutes bacterium]|nr:Creatinine amidohydrolase [Bacillota bacterium]